MENINSRSEIAENVKKFHGLLEHESDRGCVIVSAALIDDVLSQLIKRKLAPSPNKKDELLHDGVASLSTFSARIDLAYRLGLIRREVRSTLHLVKKIRNEFAHISDPASFDAPNVSDRVKEIFYLNEVIVTAMSDVVNDAHQDGNKGLSILERVGVRTTYEILISTAAA